MKRDLLAAKLKADWLDAKRLVTALVQMNDLDEEGEDVLLLKAYVTRLSINREYAFAFNDAEATDQMRLLRTDSKATLQALKRAVHDLTRREMLDPLRGTFDVPKHGSPRWGKMIPPRLIETEDVICARLREDGWKDPPIWVLELTRRGNAR